MPGSGEFQPEHWTKTNFDRGPLIKLPKAFIKALKSVYSSLKKALLRASSPLVWALTKPSVGPFSRPIAAFQITNINALSCFGKLTSLLELTLDLFSCEGLLDLDPLSSLERCVNLKKLNLKLVRTKAGTL